MRIETIHKLCCPFDKKDLALKIITRDLQDRVIEGVLTCSHCNRYYPIVCGVPIMSPDEYREKQLEAPLVKKWKPELLADEKGSFKLPPAE